MFEPLERPRVYEPLLEVIEQNEIVDRIPDFVMFHSCSVEHVFACVKISARVQLLRQFSRVVTGRQAIRRLNLTVTLHRGCVCPSLKRRHQYVGGVDRRLSPQPPAARTSANASPTMRHTTSGRAQRIDMLAVPS